MLISFLSITCLYCFSDNVFIYFQEIKHAIFNQSVHVWHFFAQFLFFKLLTQTLTTKLINIQASKMSTLQQSADFGRLCHGTVWTDPAKPNTTQAATSESLHSFRTQMHRRGPNHRLPSPLFLFLLPLFCCRSLSQCVMRGGGLWRGRGGQAAVTQIQ